MRISDWSSDVCSYDLSTIGRSVHFRNNSRSALTICFNSWHSITFAVIIRGTTTMGMSERGHELKQLRQLKEIRLRGAEAYYDLVVDYSVRQGDVKVDLVQAQQWFNLPATAGRRQGEGNKQGE